MPTRFDHAVIVVRDLASAQQRFQELGFDAQPGGRHTGRGTHNALIRFGLDYVELLSVYDEAEARAFNGSNETLLDALHGREAALFGFALATQAIEEDATRFTGRGSTTPTPNSMRRARPDGNLLTWRTLAPEGNSWNRPWPFLIQWDTPDEERLKIDLPGTHANGANGWLRVAVATQNLQDTLAIYQNQLGLERKRSEGETPHQATLTLGKSFIDLQEPGSDPQLQQILTEKGEGPHALTFSVQDLEQTRSFLKQHAIAFEEQNAGQLALATTDTLSVPIVLASIK